MILFCREYVSYLLCLLLCFVIIVSYGIMHLAKWLDSPSVMSDSLRPHRLYTPWNSPGQNSGVGSPSFLQEIFSNQRSNPGLPHCMRILYQVSHKGSPRIMEWVASPFSGGSSQPRNRTGVSCIANRFFTNWAMGEALMNLIAAQKNHIHHINE